ncbi:MAG: VWA domain-containing protein [Betaproteobacteria bacterium]|nr:VWA domain-containing protein [Betaproteobacteria bacterium]
MGFVHPSLLWLLLLAPLPGILAWAGRRRHGATRLAGAAVMRTMVLILVIVAAAGPQTKTRTREVSVVYVVDVSRSVATSFLQQSLAWIGDLRERYHAAHARYVVFAATAERVERVEDIGSVVVSEEARDRGNTKVLGQGETDIERALRAALGAFAPGAVRRLVLITDGNQTRGDYWRVLPALRASGVRVFSFPAVTAVTSDAWIERITPAGMPRQQTPLPVRVNVQATQAMTARVRLAAGDRVLADTAVRLVPGANPVDFEIALPRRGPAVLAATVHAEGDQFRGNDRAMTGVTVAPRPSVLYVEGMPESAYHLADALRAHHVDVTVVTPRRFEAEFLASDRHDVVVLSDVKGEAIGPRTADALEAFVRERGRGLVFAAGENTHGRDGFAGSVVERLLPVTFEARRKRRDLDLVLLIDRSHSMRGRKLELAKTAALSTLDLLDRHHRLAVVGFDAKTHTVVPLEQVGSKRRAEDRISGMTASGQTNLYPALLEASRLLANSRAAMRHVILLSDGVTAPPPPTDPRVADVAAIQAEIQKGREEAMRSAGMPVPSPEKREPLPPPGALETLVHDLARTGVTVSTVAIGDRPNLPLMADIAVIGKGRSYVAKADADLPGLFVRETRRLLGDAIVEEPFHARVARRTAALAGIDFAHAPPLLGFVATRAKRFAEVELDAPKRQPLLASTHYGLGKSVAFLSDVKNRWAVQWLGWAGYGRLWAQVIRHALPDGGDSAVVFDVAREGSTARVELQAYDRDHGFGEGLRPQVHVTSPEGVSTVLPMRPVAPGRYVASADIEAGLEGSYRFELLAKGGLTSRDAAEAGVRVLPYAWPDELRGLPADVQGLRALAEETGGAFVPAPDTIFAPPADGPLVPRSWWRECAGLALALFLCDILWRRLPWGAGGSAGRVPRARWWRGAYRTRTTTHEENRNE